MPAKSRQQQKFMGLVRAVQKGTVPKDQVTSNIRQTATDMSPSDVEDMASTKTDSLPDRVRPLKKHDETNMIEDRSPLTFGDVVRNYEALREYVANRNKFSEIAEQLMAIAEFAEQTITNELAEDWYDGHTVKRNIGEMKKYVSEFGKLAKEADQQNQRMGAYYEDMGRILERYFQVYDEHAADVDPNFIDPNTTGRPPEQDDPYDMRAVSEYRSRLSESKQRKFDKLPVRRQVEVAWRLL